MPDCLKVRKRSGVAMAAVVLILDGPECIVVADADHDVALELLTEAVRNTLHNTVAKDDVLADARPSKDVVGSRLELAQPTVELYGPVAQKPHLGRMLKA